MTADQLALWEGISAFDIDGDSPAALPFAARLARENGWSRSFADRAVREYKRFVYLAMTVGRPMCPSEAVDQVWHLHLTYTRSYWQRFCGEVLKGPLHHDPTRGGEAEGPKHWAMYADTLLAYAEVFGEEPPADLWPPADERFGPAADVARIHRGDYWLVRKPRVPRRVLVAGSLGVATVLAVGCAGNPFDTKGTDFLPYLCMAWAMAYVLGLIVRRVYRGYELTPGDPVPELDAYELAYLTGGRGRVLTTALVRLKDLGVADIANDGHVIVRRQPENPDPVEAAVYGVLAKQSGNPFDLRPAAAAVAAVENSRFGQLAEQGLVPTPAARTLARLLPLMLSLGTLALVGLPRLVMGLANNRPSGYLILSLIVLFVVTVVTFGRPLRRTRKAEAVLANLSQRHARLRTLRNDLPAGEAALAVALFGATVLSGTAYAAMYDRVHRYDAGGTGGGCSTTTSGCGGGGGGGGCGSGCGGCGGGGGD